MSRDLAPKEILLSSKIYPDLANLVDNLMIEYKGETKPAYSDEQKEIAHKYPNLGICGFDMLMLCKELGILKSELGQQLLQQVEDMLNAGYIKDKDFHDIANRWFEGNLEPGYYLEDNDRAFAYYLKERIENSEKK